MTASIHHLPVRQPPVRMVIRRKPVSRWPYYAFVFGFVFPVAWAILIFAIIGMVAVFGGKL